MPPERFKNAHSKRTPSHLNSIHTLWDKLVMLPASEPSAAIHFLLESICELINAEQGYWLHSFRMNDSSNLDPMLGWRAGAIHYFNKRDVDHGFHERGVKAFERGAADESSIKHAREAGSFRATLLKDHVSKNFFKSEHYLQHYITRNITDTMYIVAPVNSDTEVYFCFNRINRADSFKQSDLERASHALRGLKWFNQKMLLGQGLMLAKTPLTPTERKVLSNLLTDKSEKQIAVILNKRTDTIHKHVSSIYRKFNVQSRAALMAIWLGQLPERSPAND